MIIFFPDQIFITSGESIQTRSDSSGSNLRSLGIRIETSSVQSAERESSSTSGSVPFSKRFLAPSRASRRSSIFKKNLNSALCLLN